MRSAQWIEPAGHAAGALRGTHPAVFCSPAVHRRSDRGGFGAAIVVSTVDDGGGSAVEACVSVPNTSSRACATRSPDNAEAQVTQAGSGPSDTVGGRWGSSRR